MGWRECETVRTGLNERKENSDCVIAIAGNVKVELWMRDLRRGYRCDQTVASSCVYHCCLFRQQ